MILFSLLLFQQSAGFFTDAPLGTGLEWMALAAVLVPAILLVALVYIGADRTV